MLWQMYQIRDDPRILVDLVLELLVDQQDVRGLAPELEEFIARDAGRSVPQAGVGAWTCFTKDARRMRCRTWKLRPRHW